jgi:predicted dehydrogenase
MQTLTRDVNGFGMSNLLRKTSGKRLNKGVWRLCNTTPLDGAGTRMPFSENDHVRFALVGAGSRASLYTEALGPRLVAIADTNPVRVAYHQARHATPVAGYAAAEFARMLSKEDVDRVVVTTVDRFHDDYIVAALDAGVRVVTEKPMTIDAARCRRILAALAGSPADLVVTFNYRYNPVHEAVKRILAAGEIGEVGSVHFEWLLDTSHGADYFRRWHRDKANSGGLLVHKASHHFDLVNWWLADEPVSVYAAGRLFFYGPSAAGLKEGYGSAFDMSLVDDPRLRALYVDAAGVDGYVRNQDVFAPGVSIEDDVSVVVRYARGATMTYHLTAYSPWEGYRLMVNGSRGRLELDVSASGAGLRVCPFWSAPVPVPVEGYSAEGHGGGDVKMLADILSPPAEPDPLGRRATATDGARALLVGVAGNESLATGRPVFLAELLA